MSRSWIFLFATAAIVASSGYTYLSHSVISANAEDCDDKGLSIQERAACIIHRDDARATKRQAERQKAEEIRRKKEEEERALNEEIMRQRYAPRRVVLQAEISRRLKVLGEAGLTKLGLSERKIYGLDTERLIGELLQLTPKHPLSVTYGKEYFPPRRTPLEHFEAKQIPAGGDAATREAYQLCLSVLTVGWQQRCAEFIYKNMLIIRPSDMSCYLRHLTHWANWPNPPPPSKSRECS